jgi:hypothetical protein
MTLPDFERVEKLLRFGSVICGLSLIPRYLRLLRCASRHLSIFSGVFGLLDIFDPMYMVVSGALVCFVSSHCMPLPRPLPAQSSQNYQLTNDLLAYLCLFGALILLAEMRNA